MQPFLSTLRQGRHTATRVALPVLLILAGCGSSGSDEPEPEPGFPLASAYKATLLAGSVYTFDITGTCTGTASVSANAAQATASPAGYRVQRTYSASFNDAGGITISPCTPSRINVTSTATYDDGFRFTTSETDPFYPLGILSGAAEFRSSLIPSALPTEVRPGDEAVYATVSALDINSRQFVIGKYVLSYRAVAETANSVLIDLISTGYRGEDIYFTRTESYRLTKDGTLKLTMIRVRPTALFSGSVSLVFTPR